MKNIELGKDELLEITPLKRQTLKNMIVGEKIKKECLNRIVKVNN
jgi:hypothetical protein